MEKLGQFVTNNLALVVGAGLTIIAAAVCMIYVFTTMKGKSDAAAGKVDAKINTIDSIGG